MTDTVTLPYRPCVGVMLLNMEGLVFVGRRSERKGASEGEGQWWQMPQGGIDKGEDAEEAARRELWEETGVREARFLAQTEDASLDALARAAAERLGLAYERRPTGYGEMAGFMAEAAQRSGGDGIADDRLLA